jgi:hypothetical protein
MRKILDFIVPHVGIEFNLSPLVHFGRDLLLVFILWQIGYRDFQAALAVMLTRAFSRPATASPSKPMAAMASLISSIFAKPDCRIPCRWLSVPSF